MIELNYASSFRAFLFLFGGATLFLVSGCGGGDVDLASVSGTITMDGKPLKEAMVIFEPVNPGRAAIGSTNDQGEYELKYSARSSGALVGPMRVEIRTGRPDNPRQYPETVPARYNTRTELTANVESKPNVIDFDLKSK